MYTEHSLRGVGSLEARLTQVAAARIRSHEPDLLDAARCLRGEQLDELRFREDAQGPVTLPRAIVRLVAAHRTAERCITRHSHYIADRLVKAGYPDEFPPSGDGPGPAYGPAQLSDMLAGRLARELEPRAYIDAGEADGLLDAVLAELMFEALGYDWGDWFDRRGLARCPDEVAHLQCSTPAEEFYANRLSYQHRLKAVRDALDLHATVPDRTAALDADFPFE